MISAGLYEARNNMRQQCFSHHIRFRRLVAVFIAWRLVIFAISTWNHILEHQYGIYHEMNPFLVFRATKFAHRKTVIITWEIKNGIIADRSCFPFVLQLSHRLYHSCSLFFLALLAVFRFWFQNFTAYCSIANVSSSHSLRVQAFENESCEHSAYQEREQLYCTLRHLKISE